LRSEDSIRSIIDRFERKKEKLTFEKDFTKKIMNVLIIRTLRWVLQEDDKFEEDFLEIGTKGLV